MGQPNGAAAIRRRAPAATTRWAKPSVRAVEDVSFTIATRQFAALQGPSGSGKSTLLNLWPDSTG